MGAGPRAHRSGRVGRLALGRPSGPTAAHRLARRRRAGVAAGQTPTVGADRAGGCPGGGSLGCGPGRGAAATGGGYLRPGAGRSRAGQRPGPRAVGCRRPAPGAAAGARRHRRGRGAPGLGPGPRRGHRDRHPGRGVGAGGRPGRGGGPRRARRAMATGARPHLARPRRGRRAGPARRGPLPVGLARPQPGGAGLGHAGVPVAFGRAGRVAGGRRHRPPPGGHRARRAVLTPSGTGAAGWRPGGVRAQPQGSSRAAGLRALRGDGALRALRRRGGGGPTTTSWCAAGATPYGPRSA